VLFRPAPLHIITAGRFGSMSEILRLGGSWGFAASNWGTANLARYYPVTIPNRFTVARFMSPNNNATGNADIGLYGANFARLLSTGTAARSGAPAVQYIDVTNQSFPPGLYYLAMVCSSTTSQVFTTAAASLSQVRMTGALEEALGSTVLPATMTPVTTTSTGNIQVWGFTQSDAL
jgi:hypothetical protein